MTDLTNQNAFRDDLFARAAANAVEGSPPPRDPQFTEVENDDDLVDEIVYVPMPGLPDELPATTPDGDDDVVKADWEFPTAPDRASEDLSDIGDGIPSAVVDAAAEAPPRDPRFVEIENDDDLADEVVFDPEPGTPSSPPATIPGDGDDVIEEAAWGMPPSHDKAEPGAEAIGIVAPEEGDADEDGAVASRRTRVAVPIGMVTIFPHALVDPERVAPVEIEKHAAEIRASGQPYIPVARELDDGRYEVARDSLEVLAVRHLDDGSGNTLIDLDVLPLSNAEMFVHAQREGRPGSTVLAYDRARSIRAALDELGGTQKQIAQTLVDEQEAIHDRRDRRPPRDAAGTVVRRERRPSRRPCARADARRRDRRRREVVPSPRREERG